MQIQYFTRKTRLYLNSTWSPMGDHFGTLGELKGKKGEEEEGKKWMRNWEIVVRWMGEVVGNRDSWIRTQICPILELRQTLKECLCCQTCCAQLCTLWRTIVTASCAVSNRKSRYPPLGLTHEKWFLVVKCHVNRLVLTFTPGYEKEF